MVSQSATWKVSTRCASAFCPTVCPASPLPAPLWCSLASSCAGRNTCWLSMPRLCQLSLTHTHKHARTLRANCMWNLGICAGCALKISPNATHLFFICANVWPKHKDTNTYIYIYLCACVCVKCAVFCIARRNRYLAANSFCQFHVRNYKLRGEYPIWFILFPFPLPPQSRGVVVWLRRTRKQPHSHRALLPIVCFWWPWPEKSQLQIIAASASSSSFCLGETESKTSASKVRQWYMSTSNYI